MIKKVKGFTLVELLVVVSIIVILAAVGYIVVNPVEITRKTQDSNRLAELAMLQQAIGLATQETAGTQVLCNGAVYPCFGDSVTGSRTSDGTGWIKVNLGTSKTLSVPTLPIDPVNTTAYHYKYCADNDQWELSAKLHSTQYTETQDKDGGDGGDDPALYEVGSNLKLISPTGSVVGCEY